MCPYDFYKVEKPRTCICSSFSTYTAHNLQLPVVFETDFIKAYMYEQLTVNATLKSHFKLCFYSIMLYNRFLKKHFNFCEKY